MASLGFGLDRVRSPSAVPVSVLRRVHSDTYLERLHEPEGLVAVLGFSLNAARQEAFLEAQARMVGGTLLAARLALSRRAIAVNLGGGFHHAFRDRGQGFCAYNDVAVAVQELRSRGYGRPILVVDLDLHDGDGTRAIFARDSTVHTLSIHNRALGSDDAVASTSCALGTGVQDATYLRAIRTHVPSAVEATRPGLVFYLAGTDPAADDRLGDWKVSARGLLERDVLIHDLLRGRRRVPLVVLLAGGYGGSAWRYSARFFSWLLTGGRAAEPPQSEQLALDQYRHLARELSRVDLTRDEGSEPWGLNEEDVVTELEAVSPTGRFLGFYTRQGIELALERYGILDRLRERGFGPFRLELQAEGASSQTIRIFAHPCPEEPVLELCAQRDGTTLRGMDLLRVEWLQIQDPRAGFTPERPRLPGQRHPGLGLLRDVAALLVIVCERLGLDGVVFTPAHYPMARQARKVLRFLNPQDEGRFQALERLVGEMDLAAAAAAIEGGRVIDARTGSALRWRPAPMVLPVSETLKTRVETDDYERAVARSAAEARLRLGS